jgi:hypothetical protein
MLSVQLFLRPSALVPIIAVPAPTRYGSRWGAPLGLEVHPLIYVAAPTAGPVAPNRRRRWRLSNSTAFPLTVNSPTRLICA